MGDYREAQRKAHEYYTLAENTAHVAFKVVNNPKLMLPMVESLFLAMTNAMNAILSHQREQRKIPTFKENFDSRCVAFKELIPRLKIDRAYLRTLVEMRDIIISHQKSPVEFTKGNSVIICGDDYKMKILSPEGLRQYMSHTKSFIDTMEKIVNERVYV